MKTITLLLTITLIGCASAQDDLRKQLDDPSDLSKFKTVREAYDAGVIRALRFAVSNMPTGNMLSYNGGRGTLTIKSGYLPTNDFSESLEFETEMSTNWLAFTLKTPNGDGTVSAVPKEASLVLWSRYAKIISNETTNRVLVSQKVVPWLGPIIRDPIPREMFLTNFAFPSTGIFIK